MSKRTVLMAAMVVAALVVVAGCSGARAEDELPAGVTSTTSRQRVLLAGTALDLRSNVLITSASSRAGDPVSATMASAALSARGDTVIPVGAVLSGTVVRIGESGSPGSPGTLQLALSTLTIGSRNYPVDVAVTSMATHLNKAVVTTEDAAKVAAGAAIGAIAGRVIGGNRTGTLIGAGAGAVGGTVYATQTRDRDIVLSKGAAIGAVLTERFSRTFTARN